MKEYLEDVPLCTIPINIGKHWVAVYIDRSRGAAEARRASLAIAWLAAWIVWL